MKKYWFIALAILAMTGCAEGNPDGNNNGGNGTTSTCGDGILNKSKGEVCDTQLDVACSAIDSTKTWQAGGKANCNQCKSIDIGSCVEMPNMCDSASAACKQGDTKTCVEFDNTKKWQAGGMATCAADCGSFVIGTCVEELCGNMQIDNGEACDKALALSCNAFNDEVNWKPGGAPVCKSDCSEIEIGTCVEDDGQTVTPNPTTKCDTPEAKCSLTDEISCNRFDDTKKWKADGKAACSADCSAIEIGTCVEDLCGNGNVDIGEACDTENPLTCDALNRANGTDFGWKPGGAPVCKSDCSAIEIGTCVELECTDSDDCEDNKICSDNVCVAAPVCGNGIVDAGETCDFTGKQKCKDIDPNWMSGEATCTDCTLDTSECVLNETAQGLHYCQLMKPVIVKFDPTHKSETLNVKYAIGNDVTENGMTAELVYGVDFKNMAKWKSVAATQDADKDAFSATLTDANVSSYGDNVHYTFRIKTDSSAEWQYCKRNNPDKYTDANTVQADLKPYTLKEAGQISSNVNETGFASVTTIASSNIIAEFNFDDNTKATGSSLTGYTADVGTGIITAENNAWCNQGNCFVNGENGGNALSLKNWVSTKDKLLKNDSSFNAAHIDISSLKTSGISHVNMSMRIWRNATDAATNIVVYYTTKTMTSSEVRDITLNTSGENGGLKTYFDYTVQLPETVGNQDELTIHLAPYGGNGLLRFDDIVISKGN